MLYLLHPHEPMQWIDLNPGQLVVDVAKDTGRDLADLKGWEPSERSLDEDTLRLSLRHGVVSRAGIVVDAVRVSPARRAAEMRKLAREGLGDLPERPVATEDYLEALMPGWKARGQELDARVAESLERSAREAQEDLRLELEAVEADGSLVEHWARLGGSVPDPV